MRRFSRRSCGGPLSAPRAAQKPSLFDLNAEVQRDSNDARKHYRYGLALAYLPYLRRSQLRSEERRGHVPDAWKTALEDARRFYRRAFVLDPFVSLRVLSVMFPPARWRNRDYTSSASIRY